MASTKECKHCKFVHGPAPWYHSFGLLFDRFKTLANRYRRNAKWWCRSRPDEVPIAYPWLPSAEGNSASPVNARAEGPRELPRIRCRDPALDRAPLRQQDPVVRAAVSSKRAGRRIDAQSNPADTIALARKVRPEGYDRR